MSNKRELNGSNKCELNGSILLPRALHGIKMLELKVLHLDKKGRLNDSMLHLNFNATSQFQCTASDGKLVGAWERAYV